MSLIRVAQSTQVTLSHVFYVDETATAPSGGCTATVKRLDGTQVSGSPFTATVTGTTCSFALPAAAAAQLDMLTVDWAATIGGAPIVVRDYVEIVGGFLFGLVEARAAHSSLASASKYPTSMLAEYRIQIEQECEDICGHAMLPRFSRVTCDGSGWDMLLTPHLLLRSVRSMTVNGTALSAGELAKVTPLESGVLYRAGAAWPAGRANIVAEVEHGRDRPPEAVRRAAITRLRYSLTANASGIPDRAVSFTAVEGGIYRISQPGAEITGIPDVDAVYARYRIDPGGFA